MSVGALDLSPEFDPDVSAYTASVSLTYDEDDENPSLSQSVSVEAAEGVTLSATFNGAALTLEYDDDFETYGGTVALVAGTNMITVTAQEDGKTAKTYTVTVTAAFTPLAELTSITKNSEAVTMQDATLPSYTLDTVTWDAGDTGADPVTYAMTFAKDSKFSISSVTKNVVTSGQEGTVTTDVEVAYTDNGNTGSFSFDVPYMDGWTVIDIAVSGNGYADNVYHLRVNSNIE